MDSLTIVSSTLDAKPSLVAPFMHSYRVLQNLAQICMWASSIENTKMWN